jgi:hypothetical protein
MYQRTIFIEYKTLESRCKIFSQNISFIEEHYLLGIKYLSIQTLWTITS